MEPDKIAKTNVLIAEKVMGLTVLHGNYISVVTNAFGTGTRTLNFLEYHSSWDWLMPVVEKIESLGFRFEVAFNEVDLYDIKEDRFSTHINVVGSIGVQAKSLSKMQAIYTAVTEFAEWYNTQ